MVFYFSFFFLVFFFFNDTATTEIYTLSLHDALPISEPPPELGEYAAQPDNAFWPRSEEHTSELQSHHDLVCRLLLEKKKKKKTHHIQTKKKKKKIKENQKTFIN